jgi:hypothetical protein
MPSGKLNLLEPSESVQVVDGMLYYSFLLLSVDA